MTEILPSMFPYTIQSHLGINMTASFIPTKEKAHKEFIKRVELVKKTPEAKWVKLYGPTGLMSQWSKVDEQPKT